MNSEASFGIWLKQRRTAMDLTQERLAERVGCSVETIRKLERNVRRPSLQVAERLAELLAISPQERSWFLRFARRMPEPASVHTPLHGPPPPARREIKHQRHTLPLPATPLIGRVHEVQVLWQLLLRDDVRLVTISGPPGIGKTRLALEVAGNLQYLFADGVVFVSLAAISDPVLVAQAIAQACGLTQLGRQSIGERLQDYLRERQHLIVLDNFEHLLDAAPLLAELLSNAAQLKLLVTSRVVLYLHGEKEIVVPPLTLPDLQALPPVNQLGQYEALSLFTERARDVKPDFTLSSENAAVVAEICHLLDGLPLAIELAAHSKILSPQSILDRLLRGVPFLTSGPRDSPVRQHTLRNAISWSYNLLGGNEQRLVARLSVFAGGCTLDAAEAICRTVDGVELDVLAGVASLVDSSLLSQEQADDGEPRFFMLNTIREFMLEQLLATAEADELRRQHALYFLALARQMGQLFERPQHGLALQRLDTEHNNLRAAMQWAVVHGHPDLANRLVSALWRFWALRGYLSEGRYWLQAVLQTSGSAPTVEHGWVLLSAGVLAGLQGDLDHTKSFLQQALSLFNELGDQHGGAWALHELAYVAYDEVRFKETRQLFETSLSAFRRLQDHRGIASALRGFAALARAQGELEHARALLVEALGLLYEHEYIPAQELLDLAALARQQGNYEPANVLFNQALALFRELGNRLGVAWTLHNLGELAQLQHEARAAELYQESFAAFQELGIKAGMAWSLHNQAYLALDQGETEVAMERFTRCLALFYELGSQAGRSASLAGFAALAAARGALERAAQLFSAAEAHSDAAQVAAVVLQCSEGERWLSSVRAQLPPATFAAAWARGRKLTWQDAVAYALAELPFPDLFSAGVLEQSAGGDSTQTSRLTARKVELLQLISHGLTEAQIAQRLGLQRRAINAQLTSISRKLGFSPHSAATHTNLDLKID